MGSGSGPANNPARLINVLPRVRAISYRKSSEAAAASAGPSPENTMYTLWRRESDRRDPVLDARTDSKRCWSTPGSSCVTEVGGGGGVCEG